MQSREPCHSYIALNETMIEIPEIADLGARGLGLFEFCSNEYVLLI
jgi:hypothetical protein